MKIIYNNILPVKGFCAMNLFGVLFVRKKYKGRLSNKTINHETIHTLQQKELLYIFFYVLYICEWLIRLVTNTNSAYRSISFEREAFQNESDYDYINNRKRFSWLKYIKKK